MEITRPELVLDGGPPVRLRVEAAALTDDQVDRLKEILRRAPGRQPGLRAPRGPDRTTVLQLGDEYLLSTPRNGLFAELRVLFGADCIA